MPEIPLFEHQSRAVAAAMLQNRLWINAAYGTGKTRIALEIIKRKRAKALVIAPLTLIETSWRGDWDRFGYSMGMVFYNMRDGKADNGKMEWRRDGTAMTEPVAALAIINPEAFIRLKDEKFLATIDMLIIDEASRLKTRTTKIAKAVYEMSKRVKSVYLLSGNLAPNSEEDYFSPIRCLDETVFGPSYYGFMGRYFNASQGYAPGGVKFKKWAIKPEMRQDLAERLKKVSIRIGKEDAPELPPQTFITREVELEPEQRKIYETIKRDKILELQGKTVVAQNVIVELLRLRQAASGFLYAPDGTALGVGVAKLDALRSVLEEIGSEQVVIFSCWKEEIRQIKELLGEKAGCVYGEATEGEKNEAIKAFQGGDIRYLICHPRSGGVGLNLQRASYAVYASLDYSLEGYEQSLARIHRSGQTRACTYTFLIAKDTIDAEVHKALLKKANVNKVLAELMR